jgi:hypothetical protein
MEWTKVVTHPLGLVAFALALVFGLAGVKLSARNRPWFLPVAIILAVLVMVGGLFLSFQEVQSIAKPATTTAPQEKPVVKQETHGPDSPAVQGVGGDVIIDQSKSRTGK